ncbi:MAG TPA: VanZ family protein [Gemmatimonadaceae bacterium]|nr:VanZ family protein [Gemmatimonadaceae bacterium]
MTDPAARQADRHDRPETGRPVPRATRPAGGGAEALTGRTVAALGALVIAMATLTPGLNEQTYTGFCIVCGNAGGQDFLDNVLLFVPFALGLRLAGATTRRTIATGFLCSVGVELLQRWVIPGRDASVGDVVANTLGAAGGALLAAHWRALLFPAPRAARRLAALGAGAWLLVVAITAWAMGRSLPPEPAGYGIEWTPREPDGRRYDGDVVGATLAGVPSGPGAARVELPLAPGVAPDSTMRRVFDRAALRLDVSFTAERAPTSRGEPIVRVATPDSADVVVLSSRRCGVAFVPRTRAADLRMRAPSVAAPRVLPCGTPAVHAGDTLHARAWMAGGHLVLELRGPHRDVTATATAALTAGLGWSLFFPWSPAINGTAAAILTALWLGGLLLPAGYWAARGWPARAKATTGTLAVVGLALVAIGLGAVPAASAIAPTPPSAWLAALAGAALGWRLGRGAPNEASGSRVSVG